MRQGRYAGIAKVVTAADPVRHAGMGIVVGRRQVITCAHVVNAALGRKFESTDRPDKDKHKVRVAFPYARTRKPIKPIWGGVEVWHPMGGEDVRDVAVLALDEEVPETVGMASFTEAQPDGHACLVYGFRPDAPGGRDLKGGHVPGTIMGDLEDETVQLDGANFTGLFIKGGYSGAAVWDVAAQAVAGMVVEKDTGGEGRVAYMTPVAVLRKAWPRLLLAPGPPPAPEPPGGAPEAGGGPRVPYPVPVDVPEPFLDRERETREVEDFLLKENKRLLVVEGRPGQGKTVLVCRVLEALKRGRLPETGRPLRVNGVVYLSATGEHPVTAANLFAGLLACLQEPARAALVFDRQATAAQRTHGLLRAVGEARIVVLLDNFETVLDPRTGTVLDAHVDLGEALRALLRAPPQAPPQRVKVILTTQITPRDLARISPGLQARLRTPLRGLPAADAEKLLTQMTPRVMAEDASVRRKTYRRTGGNPRALEALGGNLWEDQNLTLSELLEGTEGLLPDSVTDDLVGKLFDRRSEDGQWVMKALAVYGRPVVPGGLDYVLRRYWTGPGRERRLGDALHELSICHAVRRTREGLYYLHSTDRDYALRQIPAAAPRPGRGGPRPATLRGLKSLAADYFRDQRTDPRTWTDVGHLNPLLREFDLRLEAGEGDATAEILLRLHDYLSRWGRLPDAARMAERLLGGDLRPDLARRIRLLLGQTYSGMGRYEEALVPLGAAVRAARRGGDAAVEGLARAEVALCRFYQGDFRRAVAEASRARRVTAGHGGQGCRAQVRFKTARAIGLSRHMQCRVDEALRWIGEARAEAHRLHDVREESIQLAFLAYLMAYFRGDARQATEDALAAVRLADGGGFLPELADAQAVLSFALIQDEHYPDAIPAAQAAIKVAKDLPNPTRLTFCYWCLSFAALWSGDVEGAWQAIRDGCAVNDLMNGPSVYAQLGIVLLHQGKASDAAAAFRRTLELVRNYPQPNVEANVWEHVAYCGIDLCGTTGGVQKAIVSFAALRKKCRECVARFVGRVLATAAGRTAHGPAVLGPFLARFASVRDAFTDYSGRFPTAQRSASA